MNLQQLEAAALNWLAGELETYKAQIEAIAGPPAYNRASRLERNAALGRQPDAVRYTNDRRPGRRR